MTLSPNKTGSLIPLSEMVADLRSELSKALLAGANEVIQFRLKPIDLELSIAVTRKAEANGGVQFWVVQMGGKGAVEDASIHKLKITLEPVQKGGTELRIGESVSTLPPASGTR